MVGLFEAVCAPWNVGRIPETFSFGEIPPDWDRMGPYLEAAMSRIPISNEVGIRKFFCGPESFTADLQPVVGEAPGAAQLLRRRGTQLDRHPHRRRARAGRSRTGSRPVTPTSTSRASTSTGCRPISATRSTAPPAPSRASAASTPRTTPTSSCTTARGAKLSPIHHRLAEQRAWFRDVSGWENPGWYAPEGAEPDSGEPTWGRPVVVVVLGGRAPRRPQRRDPHGHVVHGEVPRAGQGRRRTPQLDLAPTTSTARAASSPTRSGSTSSAGCRPTSP